jgi:hypothetical protein
MQRQFLLPMELVWELIVCIPADMLIRLRRSSLSLSADLNFLIAKFARLRVFGVGMGKILVK